MAFSRPCLTAAKSHIRVIVTNSLKNIAVGPDRSPVRAWRAWGERAMPVPNGVPPAKLLRRFRGKPPRWLFGAQARPAANGPHGIDADGRPALDEGHGDNADRLLERLREVHGAGMSR